jgi:hypothetical protein
LSLKALQRRVKQALHEALFAAGVAKANGGPGAGGAVPVLSWLEALGPSL